MLLALALAAPVHATEVGRAKRIGVGVDLGAPTGLSAKYFFNERQGLAVHLGAWAAARVGVQVQFEFEFVEIGDWAWGRFDLYGLAGLESGYAYYYKWRNGFAGAYGGAAAELQFHDAPVNAFLELGAGLAVTSDNIQPYVIPLIHGQIGARWHF